jgi:hypothetical protein
MEGRVADHLVKVTSISPQEVAFLHIAAQAAVDSSWPNCFWSRAFI